MNEDEQTIRSATPPAPKSNTVSPRWPDYASVWRWHFYAGIFCIPFVIVLSVTGSIYLFRPQIEAWQQRDYDRLPIGNQPQQPIVHQVRTVVASIDGSRFAAIEKSPQRSSTDSLGSATRVIVEQAGKRIRVYVDPNDSRILGSVVEEDRFIRVVRRIHGELLLGKRGSYLIELAASWTIIMVVTGMVLWFPRKLRVAGVLFPRLNQRGKTFWKDIHSVGGFWASGLIIFLIATGLPWATFWGDYFKSARRLTGTSNATQHWDGGHQTNNPTSEHQNHAPRAKATKRPTGGPSWRMPVPSPDSYDLSQVDQVIRFADTLDFLPPIVISPPTDRDSVWTIKSDTANRPRQQTIRFDASVGKVVQHKTFTDRHWVDQMVGQGIALHEGQRFGWPNQIIALLATSGLLMLSCSGFVLWWRRRDSSGLSPPMARRTLVAVGERPTRSRLAGLAGIGLVLAIYLPLFGVSLIAVLTLDWLVFSRFHSLADWLGRSASPQVPSEQGKTR